jgi:hypothetical protein
MSNATLATVRDYDQLQQAMRARADNLNINRETIDELAYLPRGYAGKVLATKPSRRIGANLIGDFLRTLGLKLLVVEDADGLARTISNSVQRDSSVVKWTVHIRSQKGKFTSRRARRIRKKTLAAMSPSKLRRMMVKVRRGRWKNRKAARAMQPRLDTQAEG